MNRGRRTGESICAREYLQSALIGFRPSELVGSQEFFPFAFAAFDQCLRGRKGHDKSPRGGHRPIVKRFQSRRAIIVRRLPQLGDEGGAVPDQGDFIATEQPEFLD